MLFIAPAAGTTSHPIVGVKSENKSQVENTAELADHIVAPAEYKMVYYTFDEIAKDMTLATYRKPKTILFSDGHNENVKSWADVAQLVIEHISKSFTLPHMPFSIGSKGKSYFLNNTPMHGTGKEMASYRKIVVHSQEVYIDTNRSTLNICASLLALFKAAQVPLNEVGVNIE